LDNLRVRITFKSGNTNIILSKTHYRGQFADWFKANFLKNEFATYNWVTWDNIFINVNEVEKVEEIYE
jgi:hypothetical protein